jgi:mitochondrial import inner membrane translocase subunit TIM50
VSLSFLLVRQGLTKDSKSNAPLTYLEQKRRAAQEEYRDMQAFIAARKGDYERLQEAERQALAKKMSGTLWGALSGHVWGETD